MITTSEAKCYRACPLRHYYRYVALRRPRVESEAMRFGSLFHFALEAWWRDGLVAAVECLARQKADAFELIKAEELLRGYHYRWAREGWTALSVEDVVKQELAPGLMFGGKVDAIAKSDESGDIQLVEHKTTSEDISPGSQYWERLKLDPQVSNYLLALRRGGMDVSGCIYDVIGTQKTERILATPEDKRRYRKDGLLYANQRELDETPEEYRARLRDQIADNPDRYYQRSRLVRLEHETESALKDLIEVDADIQRSHRLHHWPRNPGACWEYRRPCDYWAVCTREASIDDESRYRTADRPHEELEIETEEETATKEDRHGDINQRKQRASFENDDGIGQDWPD